MVEQRRRRGSLLFFFGLVVGVLFSLLLSNFFSGGDVESPHDLSSAPEIKRTAAPAVLTKSSSDANWIVERRKICDNSIVDKEKARAAAQIRDRWLSDIPSLDKTHQFHDKGLDHLERGRTYEKWEFFGPITPVCPVELTMFGARPDRISDDEVKVFCLPESFFKETSNESCVVFSIGGRNEWAFEIDVHSRTNCRIHTFDCTIEGKVPPKIQNRTTFHKLCVDGEDRIGRDGREFKSLESLITITGGKRPTLLKFDVEGFEFPLFRRWIMDADADPERYLPLMPDQMSFEMHYQYRYARGRSPAELMVLSQALYRLGYVLVYKRRNPYLVDAIEMMMQRIIC